MDWLSSSPVQLLGVGALAALVATVVARRYQRCPHCRRMVPRAHRGWLRCRACGRQYHRSVRLGR